MPTVPLLGGGMKPDFGGSSWQVFYQSVEKLSCYHSLIIFTEKPVIRSKTSILDLVAHRYRERAMTGRLYQTFERHADADATRKSK